MPFCFCPLRSGSSGNALFVQAGDVRVLIDAGLSGKAIEGALSSLDVRGDTLSALLITHEHTDHIAGAGVLSRRYDLPVYATEKTWAAMDAKGCLGNIPIRNRRAFSAGDCFYVHDLAVAPFSIPHDAADPVGFALLYGGRKLCTATDIGHISGSWMRALDGADLVLLEANHDPALLQANPRYPSYLKRRILGTRGHLSNEDSGSALTKLVEGGLKHVILGHLSAETNTPDLAHGTVCETLRAQGIRPGDDVQVDMAWRDRNGGFYDLL